MDQRSLVLCNVFSTYFKLPGLKPADEVFNVAYLSALKRTICRLEKCINEEDLIKEHVSLKLVSSNKLKLNFGRSSIVTNTLTNLWKEVGKLIQSFSSDKLLLRETGEEIVNSFENEILVELWRWLIWNRRGSDSLWVTIRNCGKDPCDEALFWEQFGSLEGHPLHPCAKTKILSSGDPFPAKDFLESGTEFGSLTHLRVLAVHTSKMTLFPSPEGFRGRFRKLYPNIVSRCEAELLSSVVSPKNYTFIFIHPANVMKLNTYKSLLEENSMILLGCTINARPTLSWRTLVPAACAEKPSPHVKLPVPIQMTSLVRYVSPVEISGSHALTLALREIFIEDQILQKLPLTVLEEEFGAHLSFGKDTGITYEQARFCSMLLRDSPQTTLKAIGQGTNAIPPIVLAALLTSTSVNSNPRTLLEEICRFYNINISTWFRKWVEICMSQLELFLRTGIALEAHQQNALVLIDAKTGFPVNLICRETGGGIIWESTAVEMTAAGRRFKSKVYQRDDVLRGIDVACNYLSHSLLRSNFGGFWRVHSQLISEVDFVIQQMRSTFLRVSTNISAHWLTLKVGGGTNDDPSQFWNCYLERVKTRIFSPVMDRKALLLMRLRRSKDEIYVKSTNPIFHSKE